MKKRSWLPVAAGLCVLVVSLTHWHVLRSRRDRVVHQELELVRSTIDASLTEQLEERVLALEYLAQPRLQLGQPDREHQSDREQWEAAAAQLMDDFGGYQAIAWLDRSYRLQWAAPNVTEEDRQLLQTSALAREKDVRELAFLERGQVILAGNTPSEPNVLVFIPVVAADSDEGYIFATLNIETLFADGPTFETFSKQFAVSVRRGEIELYRHGDPSGPQRWKAEGLFELDDLIWQVEVRPQDRFLVTHGSFLPEALLGFELLLAILLPGAIHFTQVARHLNVNLEREIRDRTTRLHTSLKFESTLKSIIERVRDSLDEERIILTSLQELAAVLQAESCNIVLYDDDDCTRISLAYQYPEQSVPIDGSFRGDLVPLSQSFQSFQKARPIQFCEIQNSSEQHPKTILACPICDEQQVLLGDIWIYRSSRDSFDRAEQNLAEQVANQCAIAIRQAKLHNSAQRKVEQLEHINHLKDEFLNTVSHELRTPLTSLKLALWLLKQAPSEQKKQQYYQMAVSQCDREIELVNDLLDLQRLEGGRYPFVSERVDLDPLINALADTAEMKASASGHQFAATLPASLGHFHTDPKLLNRAVLELLENANKYTEPGGNIELKAQVNRGKLLVSIANTATLPDEDVPQLFKKFYRASSTDFQNKGGTGLGLSLVKEIVDRFQGDISVDKQGDRVVFEVCLPQRGIGYDNSSRTIEILQKVRQQSYASR